jgi:hypothetical protein
LKEEEVSKGKNGAQDEHPQTETGPINSGPVPVWESLEERAQTGGPDRQVSEQVLKAVLRSLLRIQNPAARRGLVRGGKRGQRELLMKFTLGPFYFPFLFLKFHMAVFRPFLATDTVFLLEPFGERASPRYDEQVGLPQARVKTSCSAGEVNNSREVKRNDSSS